MDAYVSKGASISADGKYRYLLWREWRMESHDPAKWRWLDAVDGEGARLGEPKACVFVMLNPSTADGETDDPTIRRCVGFAKSLRYERIEVVNLFAYRATNPKDILSMHYTADPVGFENESYVETAAINAGIIVCAWGSHGTHMDQDQTMLGWLASRDRHTYCLGRTKSGQPKHPLYLRADSKLEPYP